MINFDDLAKSAYIQYGLVTDFKNYQGLTMPQWEELPDTIKSAWLASTKYVFNIGLHINEKPPTVEAGDDGEFPEHWNRQM